MAESAREEILEALRRARRGEVGPRPTVPPLAECALDREGLIERFTESLVGAGGEVHRVKGPGEALGRLAEILREEGVECILASEDDVTSGLDLPAWGREKGIEVLTARDFPDRTAFKRAAFEEVQAGVTGADFAVAESGTLCIVHDRRQPRLVSLAPILHIALLPVERLLPVYEQVTERLFGGEGPPPNHVTFITGSSMTGDIEANLFRGMHGPGKVIVLLLD